MKLPVNSIIDFTSLKQIFEFEEFSDLFSEYPKPIQSFDMEGSKNKNIFEILSEKMYFFIIHIIHLILLFVS